MSGPHRVRRPDWTCLVDGHDWPCRAARFVLAECYRADPEALGRLMAVLMAQAADDLDWPGPTALYHRFVAWTLHRDQACRVCGKPSHTVLAGLPARLFPCDLVHDRDDAAT